MKHSRLNDLRLYEDLTQQEIADMIHCHLHTYRKYENEIWDTMPLCKALTLAKFYDVSISYLFCKTDKTEKFSIKQNQIIKRIRYLRKRNKLTQEEVAAKIFCSALTYKRYELGKTDIPMGIVISLADLYGISPDILVGAGSILEGSTKELL